jgi:hypothetical protein
MVVSQSTSGIGAVLAALVLLLSRTRPGRDSHCAGPQRPSSLRRNEAAAPAAYAMAFLTSDEVHLKEPAVVTGAGA